MQPDTKCTITNGNIILDGKLLFATEKLSGNDFLTEAYRALKINYPKFFKMDHLAKSAFLGMEILMRKIGENIDRENTPIILYNSSSSIDVDTLFQQSMESIPSPSLFVYTLPNVMIGEICIRHKLYGENYLFISENLNEKIILAQTEKMLANQKTKEYITGYADYAHNQVEICLIYVKR